MAIAIYFLEAAHYILDVSPVYADPVDSRRQGESSLVTDGGVGQGQEEE